MWRIFSRCKGNLNRSGNRVRPPRNRTSLSHLGLECLEDRWLLSATETPNQVYVAAVYQLVLNRPGDAAGVGYWASQLDNGAALSVVATQLTHSAEYFGNIIITPAYEKYLGRAPDSAGLAYWVDQMQNHGLTDERLEAGFIGSAEFYKQAGGTNQGWVDAMYLDLLGRAADSSGESYWVGQLQNGADRAAIADGFAASLEREQQRITADYVHFLGRQPDQSGLNYWVTQFATGVTNEDVITGFVASVEFYHTQTGVDPPNGGLGDNKAALPGNYVGTFYATSTASGYGGPLNSGIDLSIDSSGVVTVTGAGWSAGYPGATGQGQVFSDGSINFSVNGASGYGGAWLIQGGAQFVFSGTVGLNASGVMTVSGTWTATTAIGHASGYWSITHQ